MSKQYTHENLNEGFRITTSKPIDDRLVVQSVSDLFNWNDSTFGEYIYNGMPVAVIKNNGSWTDPENGIYYLTRATKIEYIYDSSVETETAPDTVNQIPGRSNLGGWKRLMSFGDIDFNYPSEPGDYILTIDQYGNPQWTEYHSGDTIPQPTEDNTVLTAVDNGHGELELVWLPVSGGSDITIPSGTGHWVLVTDGTGSYTWARETQGKGLDIKNFSTELDQTEDPRPIVPSNNNIEQKEVLSNSGEVIAVDIDDSEDPDHSDPTRRPFRLMIDYSKLTNITINGGDSEGNDPVSYELTYQYWYNNTQIFERVYTKPANTTAAVAQPNDIVTINDTQYTVLTASINGSDAPSQILIDQDITVIYTLDEYTEWHPEVKYEIVSVSGGQIPEWTDFNVTSQANGHLILSDTAPQGTTSENPGHNKKYFYMYFPIYSNAFTNDIACVLKVFNGQIDTNSDICWWRTGNNLEWVPATDGQGTPNITCTQITGRTGEYRLFQTYNNGTENTEGASLALRFTIIPE